MRLLKYADGSKKKSVAEGCREVRRKEGKAKKKAAPAWVESSSLAWLRRAVWSGLVFHRPML